MAIARISWLLWTAAMAGVLVGLAYQAWHATSMTDCMIDARDNLVLCAGPLPAWLLPLTLSAGMALAATAAWRLMDRSA